MNYSNEEIYKLYGQYDAFIAIKFHDNTEEYQQFGSELMGVFLYTHQERQIMEDALKHDPLPRSNTKIKFKPSQLKELSPEKVVVLDKYGILANSIAEVLSYLEPPKNRFTEKGTKEIPNQIEIHSSLNDSKKLNRLRYGFLNSISTSNQLFTPYQEIEYWGLKIHFGKADYGEINSRSNEFTENVKIVELECKLHELTISEEQIKELADLTVKKLVFKKSIIDKEIQMSGENIKKVLVDYDIQIDELKKCCLSFNEEIIGFGNKPIYLTFERLVHIYARHVSETQIGERFVEKTVFQYKFDDIKYLLQMVVDSVHKEIQEHFALTPEQSFRRMGKRAIYLDGHYYRLEIEPSGSIIDFHPFNFNED